MSTPAPAPHSFLRQLALARAHLPALPHALTSLLQTVVVALFVLTFVLQPLLIPSESMERTLLVGDFLLFNKQIYAPADRLSRCLLPYRQVARGDIVVFHHTQPPMLIKRVVGVPRRPPAHCQRTGIRERRCPQRAVRGFRARAA